MASNRLTALYETPAAKLDELGRQMLFYLRVLAAVPRTITSYSKEIVRLLAEVALGSGALAIIGGTVGVITAMCFFTGTEVGIQGYAALTARFLAIDSERRSRAALRRVTKSLWYSAASALDLVIRATFRALRARLRCKV